MTNSNDNSEAHLTFIQRNVFKHGEVCRRILRLTLYTTTDMIEDLTRIVKACLNWLKIAQCVINQRCTEVCKTISHFLIKPQNYSCKVSESQK